MRKIEMEFKSNGNIHHAIDHYSMWLFVREYTRWFRLIFLLARITLYSRMHDIV